MARTRRLQILVTLSGLVAVIVDLAKPGTPWQPAAVFLFVFVCPGLALAVVRLIGVPDRLAALALPVPISLALGALTSEALAISDHWSPTGLLVGLVVVTVATCWIPVPAFDPRVGRTGHV